MTARADLDPRSDTAASRHVLRSAREDDVEACAAVWREALNDYLGPLGQPEVPNELGPIIRLYRHLLSTDPKTFLVAERGDAAGHASGEPAIDGFVAVVRRGRLWFLSMLFLRPKAQGRGLGRQLLAAVGAGDDAAAPLGDVHVRATATDSAQPISNGLYASLGMVPRMPLFRLVGTPDRRDVLPPLPTDIEVATFAEIAADGAGIGSAALVSELNALDRDVLGFERPMDHAYLAAEGRRGFLYCGLDGTARGYGYTSEAGRVGPVVVADPALIGPVVGHLVTVIEPRGAFGVWLPGAATDAFVALLKAGFRIDGFPTILCWDRPFTDWSRALPISPGLL